MANHEKSRNGSSARKTVYEKKIKSRPGKNVPPTQIELTAWLRWATFKFIRDLTIHPALPFTDNLKVLCEKDIDPLESECSPTKIKKLGVSSAVEGYDNVGIAELVYSCEIYHIH